MIDDDVYLLVEPYWAKLAAFTDPLEIKDFLVSEGITATRNKGKLCAIAQYISLSSGYSAFVDKNFTYSRCPHGTFPHSEAMRLFVEAFDNGFYPELVRHDPPCPTDAIMGAV